MYMQIQIYNYLNKLQVLISKNITLKTKITSQLLLYLICDTDLKTFEEQSYGLLEIVRFPGNVSFPWSFPFKITKDYKLN